ncbi:MAG: carbohydrate kinase family protein, partial [Clostridia bacterium]|nr:carbohydrate kinase family protein [Clostridia bacterium]
MWCQTPGCDLIDSIHGVRHQGVHEAVLIWCQTPGGAGMGKRIAIAGCAVLDHYKTIDMYPEHSTLTTVRERWHEVGGALCNCAIDLARLDPDLKIKTIGRVGDDDNGRIVCDTLMKYENIDVSGVISSGQSSFTDVM